MKHAESNSTFDVPKAQWEAAKAEATAVMIDHAKIGRTIAYSDLASRIHAFALKAHDPRLFHLLGQISSEEDAAGRGMLTVIVVHKGGNMQPRPGFFEFSEKDFGRDTRDILKCWVDEFRRVHAIWS